MRLVIIAFLVYIMYRLWKGAIGEKRDRGSTFKGRKDVSIGEMVQDPVCKTYISMDQAYQRQINGKKYFFCSERCADIFEKRLKEG